MQGVNEKGHAELVALVIHAWLDYAGPASSSDVQARFELSKSYMARQFKALRTINQIHVAAWRRAPENKAGKFVRLYTAGPGEDAPKPALKAVHGNPETIARYNELRAARRRSASAQRKNKKKALTFVAAELQHFTSRTRK